MQRIELDECESTQKYLEEYIKENGNQDGILVTCKDQTNGFGRQGGEWSFYPGSIAMSLSLVPNEKLTLTSLELGLIILKFFKEKNIELKLKWPNDILLNNEKKCGGIICNSIDSKIIIAGIGINLNTNIKDNFDFPAGSIELPENSTIDVELSEFIFQNRISSKQVVEEFKKHCAYLNCNVLISDNNNNISGVFVGIGENGEALIENNDKISKVYTGSMRVIQ